FPSLEDPSERVGYRRHRPSFRHSVEQCAIRDFAGKILAQPRRRFHVALICFEMAFVIVLCDRPL
ncbi:MAG: hypothetical protein ACREXU_03650, partial [Gammaproteobacteria bacterium]